MDILYLSSLSLSLFLSLSSIQLIKSKVLFLYERSLIASLKDEQLWAVQIVNIWWINGKKKNTFWICMELSTKSHWSKLTICLASKCMCKGNVWKIFVSTTSLAATFDRTKTHTFSEGECQNQIFISCLKIYHWPNQTNHWPTFVAFVVVFEPFIHD